MKLYFAHTSPYARKVRLVVIEKGLQERVEEVFQNPFDNSAELNAVNPLRKVPTLLTDEGTALYDSPVICAYLDEQSPEPILIPRTAERWAVLTGEALSDGILDAAFAIVMERRRAKAQQSEQWLARWANAIGRSIDTREADLSPVRGSISLASIGLGAALGYLDFRLPDLDWRANRPRLSEWYGMFAERPSMQKTEPPAT